MFNQAEYQKELMKLQELFKDIDPAKAKLAEGMIQDAAFIYAQNTALKESIVETGMIKVHPQHKYIQKPVETGKQYLKNVNIYAVIIKTLNSILQKNTLEEEDAFDAYLREHQDE